MGALHGDAYWDKEGIMRRKDERTWKNIKAVTSLVSLSALVREVVERKREGLQETIPLRTPDHVNQNRIDNMQAHH